MDNHNISYDDDWKTVSTPIYKQEALIEDKIELQQPKSKPGIPLLMIIQLVICALILIGGYAIKMIGGELYNDVKNCYLENYNDVIIKYNSFDNFDIDRIFKNED